jgi:hypothetical protein
LGAPGVGEVRSCVGVLELVRGQAMEITTHPTAGACDR